MRCLPKVFSVLLALGACSPAASDTATSPPEAAATDARIHAESGLPLVLLSVNSDGQHYDFTVEVASTRFEQAKGLMFRTQMGPDEGMLFPFERPRDASFWMKNTVIPLDIIFIGTDRRILNIAENTTPYSEEPLRSQGKAAAVLELNGGRSAELGIGPGDKVDW